MEKQELAEALVSITDDPQLMEVARKAIEDELTDWRERRLSTLRGNGLVIREKDGTPSQIIRFGPEVAMVIGLRALAKHLHPGGA